MYWHSGRSNELTLAKALTALSIVALVSAPIINLLTSVPQLAATIACFDRIEKYLLTEERIDCRVPKIRASFEIEQGALRRESPVSDGSIELGPVTASKQTCIARTLIHVQNASFGVKADATTILNNISVTIPRSSITMIIGPIGSGKSTLLKGILGEVPCTDGAVHFEKTPTAYCDQTPWLLNTSVRENITGRVMLDSNPFDSGWYRVVIHACAMEEDIANLPNGDASIVGSGGVNLSGGQKQRLVPFFQPFPSPRSLKLIKFRPLLVHCMQSIP